MLPEPSPGRLNGGSVLGVHDTTVGRLISAGKGHRDPCGCVLGRRQQSATDTKGKGNLNHEIFFFPERRRLNLILWEGDLAYIRKQSRPMPMQMLWSPGRWPLGPTQKKPVCHCWRGGRRCGSPSFPISPFLFCPQEEQEMPGG